MWFSQNNIEYVANLSPTGITHIEKATFTDPRKFGRKNTKKKENNFEATTLESKIDS